MISEFSLFDAMYQIIAILMPVAFIALIIYFVRSSRRKNKQLDRIEQRLDNLEKQQD